MPDDSYKDLVRRALGLLDVDRMLLAIHDVSFPSEPDEDHGRGTPYSRGGRELLGLAARLGFTGIQLGPQGDMTEDDPSPYDSASFSRNTASVSLAALVEDPRFAGLVRRDELREVVEGRDGASDRAQHRYSVTRTRRLLDRAYQRLVEAQHDKHSSSELRALVSRLDAFEARHADWLRRDALFEKRRHERADPVRAYAFRQLLVHEQHDLLRLMLGGQGLELFGDMQVGMAPRDEWGHRRAFVPGYRLGAPPSRTNPEGQPWNYPVLDPAGWGEGGAAQLLVRARIAKLLDEYDAVRIDHPHGFVCPWVYRDQGDPHSAVRAGARLLASPDLADHPALAAHAVARPDQLDRDRPRHDDHWVRELDEEQVDRYALLFDAMVACARERKGLARALVCEVLSTQPYPLARVMERHGLGRFRVTQKERLDDPNDPYRSDRADPRDWIMIGTHDTPPLWLALDAWDRGGARGERARFLAGRLTPEGQDRGAFESTLASVPGMLAQASLAELFVSPARNVMIFFSDLFGLRAIYNRPGTFSEDNWTLRLDPDYRRRYVAALGSRQALDLRVALAMALRARGGEERQWLAQRLGQLPAVP